MKEEDVFVRRLRNFVFLSEAEEGLLRALANRRVRRVTSRSDLIREGDPPHAVFLIRGGWASRYKMLEDGRRQIVGFLLPGDLCNLNNFVLREMDHAIGAITPLSYVEVPHESLTAITDEHPRIRQAMWWHMLTGISMQREWAVNLGQRTAYERMGHFFCETFYRLRAVGLTQGTTCDMPLTQIELAETTGITSVHVNRTLQELRGDGLIVLKERILDIPDLAALERAVLFSPAYLHLGSEGAHLDANQLAMSVKS